MEERRLAPRLRGEQRHVHHLPPPEPRTLNSANVYSLLLSISIGIKSNEYTLKWKNYFNQNNTKFINPFCYNEYVSNINLDCIKEYIKNEKFNKIKIR